MLYDRYISSLISGVLTPDSVAVKQFYKTNHDKYISQSVCRGLLDVSLKHNLPVIFGVLTTNSKKQAIERAGGKCGNKGEDAAHTFLKMIEYQNNLDS